MSDLLAAVTAVFGSILALALCVGVPRWLQRWRQRHYDAHRGDGYCRTSGQLHTLHWPLIQDLRDRLAVAENRLSGIREWWAIARAHSKRITALEQQNDDLKAAVIELRGRMHDRSGPQSTDFNTPLWVKSDYHNH